ncbi:S-adenosyl-L-methionine-dependent methyltransferase [Aspergillus campestris IBT 28561]|uniref:S-adenosyl-L-methionine-dependent methyltransferase n=1 Tax=Aspergillus campestris (strain IBT 28561) TaxID=1392248 RepID=A0A2I1CZL4_ASPC2|nr:S-adenosyl-L-methionine-dependent methyltransferase [Aspergillus campestris IBT 28561]PKY03058.1 S-adenosyl-L-methionine-dependent methyltransferase [Aspergillus campestris IBT 28561]
MTKESATYTHGQHPAVLRAHAWRTAANSAAYFLPHIKPTSTVLDVGCGAGTITVDLAQRLSDGHITGFDSDPTIITQAQSLAASQGTTNVTFTAGDANALPYADNTFDIVFCHQLLQHVGDPVGLLREMKRVAKSGGGIVAARESDFGSWVWYPETEGMEDWRRLYMRVMRANGGEPNAGRMLHAWARRAGFERDDVRCSTSSWCLSTAEEMSDWVDAWAERTEAKDSEFARTAVEKGVAAREELEAAARAWRALGASELGWNSVPHGEIVCVKK